MVFHGGVMNSGSCDGVDGFQRAVPGKRFFSVGHDSLKSLGMSRPEGRAFQGLPGIQQGFRFLVLHPNEIPGLSGNLVGFSQHGPDGISHEKGSVRKDSFVLKIRLIRKGHGAVEKKARIIPGSIDAKNSGKLGGLFGMHFEHSSPGDGTAEKTPVGGASPGMVR
jgi:hypothetical protein